MQLGGKGQVTLPDLHLPALRNRVPRGRFYAVAGRRQTQGETIERETQASVAVAVCGSCSTRDNFNSRFNPDYRRWFHVVAQANQTSMIALMSPPIETAFEPLREMNAYNRWNVGSDLRREFLVELAAAPPPLLVLDFFADVHFGVARLPDGRYFTDNRWKTHHTDFYQHHRDAGSLTQVSHTSDPDAYFALWTEAIDRFAEHVRATCPDSRVVVHRGYNTETFLRPANPRPVSLLRHTSIGRLDVPAANAFWDRLDDYAIETHGWDSIDLRGLQAPSWVGHPWGPFYVHYTPDYYHRFLAELIKLTQLADADEAAISLIEAAARGPLERELAIAQSQVAGLRKRLRRSRDRVAELESLGVVRGVRFALGRRVRSRRTTHERP